MNYQSKKNQMTERGNGILEMILFTPLALVVLFVGSDIGLSYLDKAMVTDAVRETSHQQLVSQISSTGKSVYQASGEGIVINNDLVTALGLSLADRISTEVSQRRISLGKAGSENEVKSVITPIILEINPTTGVVESYSEMPQITSNLGNPNLFLGSKIQVLSAEEYLESIIGNKKSARGYAIPAPIYNDSGNLFLPQALGFLITVEALSPSINPVFLERILGSNLGIQIQDFHVIRN